MHELSLAAAALEAAAAAAREQGAIRILRVRMRVGELTAVDPGAFRFGWEVLTADHPLGPAIALDLERVPVGVACGCGYRGAAPPERVLCPRCGSAAAVVSGEELDVVEVEIDVPDDIVAAEGAGGE